MRTVAERIRQRRLALGLSQRQLASDGISAAHISRLENGDRRPSITALRSLAASLDVTVHWLETGQDDPAHELARLVLDSPRHALPTRAHTLAQAILKNRNP